MKRAFIGGFISLIGSIWALAIIFMANSQLVSGWTSPPGRFLTTVLQIDMMPWFVISLVFVVLGIVLMVIEYFRKND